MSAETWSARLPADLVAQARRDGATLGLDGSSEILRAALAALHREAHLEAAITEIDAYYQGHRAPLPIGVRPSPRRPATPPPPAPGTDD